MSFSSPLLGSSPPAKTASWPINKARGGLSRGLAQQPVQPRETGPVERRGSETGQARQTFSFSRTPFASSSATASANAAARPPAGPQHRPNLRVEGFCAPSSADSSASVALSPGKLQTKCSLLTASLLEPAERTLSAELFGAAQPAQGYQDLVVLSDVNCADAAPPVDMAPLLELQALHPVFSSSNVVAAYACAARAHAGQFRKNGESVLAHLLATACILAELGMPEEVVAAGLLHDVLCDTHLTAAQLAGLLPASVVHLVERVSQLNRLSQNYRDNTHSLEAEAMLDMLTGMDDVSALLIKLADRLHNMRTVGALSRCKQVRMASETLDVFAVLANRLGAWAIKAELEDLSFKTLNPEEYQLVQQAVAARTAADAGRSAAGGLADGMEQLTAALEEAGLEVVDVSGRVKNVYGVWKKIQKQLGGSSGGGSSSSRSRGCRSASDDNGGTDGPLHDQDPEPHSSTGGGLPPGSPPQRLSPAAAAVAAGSSAGSSSERAAAIAAAVSHIYDVQALRVVVPHKHDCYAAMRVVQGLWSAMPGRVKDYIRERKANGYQSLHLTVRDGHGQPLEIQIRTPKMHYIAEYGFAAHWRYKERLGRQDLWLDRLVQWKRWVASEKLGIVDRKLRPSGSPGGAGGGDAALADLATRLQLERAASGGGAAGAAVEAALTAAVAAAGNGGSGGGDAMAAELAAVVRARSLQQQQQQAQQVAAVTASAWRQPALAAVAAAEGAVSSSPADERFASRFRMTPISQAELEAHGAAVMVSGPRGVSIAQLPARCTVGQLLASRELTDTLRRAGSGGLGGGALLQQVLSAGSATATPTGACKLAVNGVVVLPGQADQIVLKSGDQVQLLEEPPLLPLLGLGSGSGNPAGQPASAFAVAAGPRHAVQAPADGDDADADEGRAGLLPGAMVRAGSNLQLFQPGQGEAMEVSLQHKLGVSHRLAVRAPALVS